MSVINSVEIVNKVLNTLTSDLTEASKNTWKAIVPVYQVDAIQKLVYGGVALFVSILCISVVIYLTGVYIKHQKSGEKEQSVLFTNYGAPDIAFVIPMFISFLFGITAIIVTIVQLTNVWNWVALWNPQSYTIHMILMHVLH